MQESYVLPFTLAHSSTVATSLKQSAGDDVQSVSTSNAGEFLTAAWQSVKLLMYSLHRRRFWTY